MGAILMSKKERNRLEVLGWKERSGISLKVAAETMGVSYRQAKRIWRRYKADKGAGLVHLGRGKKPNCGYGVEVKEQVLRAYEERYRGFGPTLASEKLEEEDGIRVDHETLRRWLISGGMWERQRKPRKHRQRRERKPSFGDLIQMDGSHHEWFEGRGPKSCLLSMVDDATGITMAMMAEEETTESAMLLLKEWIMTYGMPVALYTDRKNVYIVDRARTEEEVMTGKEPLSAFGKVCKKLGIRIIAARSPQAKGRVERKHGVYQDRWVKELRLKGVDDLAGANRLLGSFTGRLNEKFAKDPASEEDHHRPMDPDASLADIFCWEETRVLRNDWTVRYDKRIYQVIRQSPLPPAKQRITILRRMDGSLWMEYRGQSIQFKELTEETTQKPDLEAAQISKEKWRPPYDHPWRVSFRKMIPKNPADEPAAALSYG
jgi:molybdenum-dependent DNA-binding transcriptional regulator ModE